MKTMTQFYPIFEEDQVLTAEHLNSLREYLNHQDRLTRTHLIGIGIVCGLELVHTDDGHIKITRGVGVTSKGYLLHLPASTCVAIKSYQDKKMMVKDGEEDSEQAGFYDDFIDPDTGKQVTIWELLTEDEEKDIVEEATYPFDWEAGTDVEGVLHTFENYCVVLYLEIEDEDLEDCCGDDCDEEGIRRNFTVRKLLVHKDHLKPESGEEQMDPLEGCSSLGHTCIERLGYYSNNNLSLDEYYSYRQLVFSYVPIIQNTSAQVQEMLTQSYKTVKPLVEEQYSELPFPWEESGTGNELQILIGERLTRWPFAIQYAYDFVKDLIDAYNEFRDTACEVMAVCCPDTTGFKRHLSLGPALPVGERKRTPCRHYFQPSPILDDYKDCRRKTRLLFQRLVEMVKSFEIPSDREMEIRITPDKTLDHPLSHRSIPFYYNVKERVKLLKSWNYKKAKLFNWNRIPSYYSEFYNTGKYRDKCTVEALSHFHSHCGHYRVEGHIGKKYEETIDDIDGMRKKYNLAFDVVGVKLSGHFENTSLAFECRFEDLENMYATLRTELKCLLTEEMAFFRGLDIPEKTEETDQEMIVTGRVVDAVTGEPLPGVSVMVKGTTRGTATDMNGNYRLIVPAGSETLLFNYVGYNNQEIQVMGRTTVNVSLAHEDAVSGYDIKYTPGMERSLGFIFDTVEKKAAINVENVIKFFPGVLDFDKSVRNLMILKPALIAEQIEALSRELTRKLGDLNVDDLSSAYQALVQTAKEYKTELEAYDGDLGGQKSLIIYRIEKLIYSCDIQKLKELYRRYRERVREFKRMNLFANYASRHSGMEHLAGVPKGGTLVLVYIDQNEESPYPYKARNIAMYEEGAYLMEMAGERVEKMRKEKRYSERDREKVIKSFRKAVSEGEVKIEQQKAKQIERYFYDRLFGGWESEAAEEPPDNVVVADFALPYLCRGDCPELATMVISQISFSLPKDRFCKYDTSTYSFITEPSGGTIKSTAGGLVEKDGEIVFKPSESNLEGKEDIQFTYMVSNQTVVFNARVFDPRADFTAEVTQQDDGRVKVEFTNKSTGARDYEWDFGDGAESIKVDPVHIYKDFDEDEAIVTLVAKKQGCSHTVSKPVEMPEEIDTQFDLQRPKGVEEYKYCNTDTRLYAFMTIPSGLEITGDDTSGVIKQNESYFLQPSAYTDEGVYIFNYGDESLDVKILQGLQNVSFDTNPVDIGAEQTTMELKYTGPSNYARILWQVFDANGESQSIENKERLEWTFYNTGQKHPVTLHVEAENGCPEEESRMIDVLFEEEQPASPGTVVNVVDNLVDRVAITRDTEKDEVLFGGKNTLLDKTEEKLLKIREILADEEERKKYEEGEKNLEIAKEYENMLSETAETIKTRAKTAREEEMEYLSDIYNRQLEQLLELASKQNKDIRGNSKIGQVLKSVKGQINDMKELGLEIDPKNSVAYSLNRAKKQAKKTDMRLFGRILDELKDIIIK